MANPTEEYNALVQKLISRGQDVDENGAQILIDAAVLAGTIMAQKSGSQVYGCLCSVDMIVNILNACDEAGIPIAPFLAVTRHLMDEQLQD